jgi:hypothetical protein
LFDVIEHIEDDAAFLAGVRRAMSLDGRLYLTVPAYETLWSAEDDLAGHYRRFTTSRMAQLLTRTGFASLYATYIFRPLPLPVFLLRSLPHRLGFGTTEISATTVRRDHAPSNGALRGLLTRALQPEADHIAARKRMRFGGSCLVVAGPT